MDKLYSANEFAKKVGFSRLTIIRAIQNGKIKAYKLNKEYRIPESEIEKITVKGGNE